MLPPGLLLSVLTKMLTPSGAMRRYSLVGTGEEPESYVIAVKREPESRGGSRSMHEQVQEGTELTVEPPENEFPLKDAQKYLLIAGGIGITPFLAWAESLTEAESRDIHLIYCVPTQEEAIGVETLRAAAARNPRFSFEVVVTTRDGRLTAERLIGAVPFAIRQADLWFCGPTGLKDGILKGLKAQGQTPRRVRFEQFEFT